VKCRRVTSTVSVPGVSVMLLASVATDMGVQTAASNSTSFGSMGNDGWRKM